MARPVAELVAEAAARLASAGIATPQLDAELLLRHVLGWDRARIFAFPDEPVAADAAARYGDLVARRAGRVPLQHLTGVQSFWRHEFLVTPDVLIPRPETEILVEQALVRLRPRPKPAVLDVGTGSGCIALSLAAELPGAEVEATDLSAAALAVARENARRLGLAARVRFHEGDLLAPVSGRSFDLIASNPPYVDPAAALEPEVRDHEPALALFPPGGPLALYERLLPQAASALRPGGFLLLELGIGQADDVGKLVAAAGLAVDDVARDLQGIPRTLVARRGA
jgi:release factor glutamine methyltransferase